MEAETVHKVRLIEPPKGRDWSLLISSAALIISLTSFVIQNAEVQDLSYLASTIRIRAQAKTGTPALYITYNFINQGNRSAAILDQRVFVRPVSNNLMKDQKWVSECFKGDQIDNVFVPASISDNLEIGQLSVVAEPGKIVAQRLSFALGVVPNELMATPAVICLETTYSGTGGTPKYWTKTLGNVSFGRVGDQVVIARAEPLDGFERRTILDTRRLLSPLLRLFGIG